jgi:hypothetical protein
MWHISQENEMELGNTIQGNEQKGLSEFHMLKDLEKGSVIKGVHQGRFESKKTPGYFFHVFKDVDGTSKGYGTCQALDDRINEIKAKELEVGRRLYSEITFNGRIPSKKNPKMTYYNFSKPTMIEVIGPEGDLNVPQASTEAQAETPSASDIPF